MKGISLLSLACVAAISIGCGNNHRSDTRANNTDPAAVGTTGNTAANNANTPTSGDKDFINDTAAAGIAEVELGKLATERGASADVKRFGQMMVNDHQKANDELKQIATRFDVPLPTVVDEKHRDLQEKLSKLQGGDFDRQYMDAMVDGHGDVIDKLESRVDKHTLSEWKTKVENVAADARGTERGVVVGVTPEHSDNAATMAINEWAAKTLPTVQMHHDAAKIVKDKVDKNRRNATH
jgi:putative membrane protein